MAGLEVVNRISACQIKYQVNVWRVACFKVVEDCYEATVVDDLVATYCVLIRMLQVLTMVTFSMINTEYLINAFARKECRRCQLSAQEKLQ